MYVVKCLGEFFGSAHEVIKESLLPKRSSAAPGDVDPSPAYIL